jgi:hypothetical protein
MNRRKNRMKVDKKRIVLTALLALGLSGVVFAQAARINTYQKGLQGKMSVMVAQGQTSKVNMNDSPDGAGLDVEIRLTMGIREFESFAPIAACEAAALPHKFDVVNIYLRHEATGRVGRIAFHDAEPIAAKYNAGERAAAIEDMKGAIIWH